MAESAEQRLADVVRYATLMLDSISLTRREMAEDILALAGDQS